ELISLGKVVFSRSFDNTQVEVTVPVIITQGPAVPVPTIWVDRIPRTRSNDSRGRVSIRERTVAVVGVNVRPWGAVHAMNRDHHPETAVIINIPPTRAAPRFVQIVPHDSGPAGNTDKALCLAASPRHKDEHCCHYSYQIQKDGFFHSPLSDPP